MSLPGKIISVQETTVTVEVNPRPECKGCHACTGLSGGEKKSATRQITALKGKFSPAVGDEVILDINPGEGSLAALLVFGLPLAFFFLGLFFAPSLCNFFSIQLTDLSRFFAAFIGLAIGFVILALVSRSKPAKSLTLKIIAIEKKN
ncbi:MAG: hypothetical protein Kow0029_13050 [Candidatus Rifleibacteriota bacterium]